MDLKAFGMAAQLRARYTRMMHPNVRGNSINRTHYQEDTSRPISQPGMISRQDNDV